MTSTPTNGSPTLRVLLDRAEAKLEALTREVEIAAVRLQKRADGMHRTTKSDEGHAYANGIEAAISVVLNRPSARHASGCMCDECEAVDRHRLAYAQKFNVPIDNEYPDAFREQMARRIRCQDDLLAAAKAVLGILSDDTLRTAQENVMLMQGAKRALRDAIAAHEAGRTA